MFEPSTGPRVFALPPGADFGRELVFGLKQRLSGQPPEAMARVELILNTRRMQRRVEEMFATHGAGFLPRIRLVTDLADPLEKALQPRPVPALRRKLELAGLIQRLVAADPKIAPKTSVFDLADTLNGLIDEMQAEGVTAEDIAALDVNDQSGHWARALAFLNIVNGYLDRTGTEPDAAELNRRMLQARLTQWRSRPPDHPVIVAGSTGSRGTAFRLMQAVAHLPQGAVVLPGMDTCAPASVWDVLGHDVRNQDAMHGEDHPQFRFARLFETLGIPAADVQAWTPNQPLSPARNALVSLALRPAPVTDQWLSEGPQLPPLNDATQSLTMLEAASPRDEAHAIALRLRQAAEDGTVAALITPDRMLTRRVTALLDQWHILPDDSAGKPAHLSAPGRLLRHVARLGSDGVTAETLLTILKHPLCHRGADRGQHLLWTTGLELYIRENGIPFPTRKDFAGWPLADEAVAWLDWVEATILQPPQRDMRHLTDHLEEHLERTERLCAGSSSTDATELWAQEAGKVCRALFDDLTDCASSGTDMTAQDYANLVDGVLRGAEVRDSETPHPHILIWGTIEARVMGADLVILGGLNEGVWPGVPPADPWLNRRLRQQAGLLLPERRIGLSAHDFQQAMGAKEVWMTRARRSEDAETVPSRWLNRLTNLLRGLEDTGGPAALKAMRDRGALWLRRAVAHDAPVPAPRAQRPSPAPPVVSRPTKLSVTNIETLIRDPYAIYAAKVLRLYPLNPLQRAPDALARGNAIHEIFHRFIDETSQDVEDVDETRLIATARQVLDATVPWPTERIAWSVKIERIAAWFIAQERVRRDFAKPEVLEKTGAHDLQSPAFRITAKVDRIDVGSDRTARVYDYKTGTAPSENEQKAFNVQLLLTAAIVTEGGFEKIGPAPVIDARYISLSGDGKEVAAPLNDVPIERVWSMLAALIGAYSDPGLGYTARNRMQKDRYGSDYDHLSRFGEWDASEPPQRVILT